MAYVAASVPETQAACIPSPGRFPGDQGVGVIAMANARDTRLFAHRANIARYRKILETPLTNEERVFLKRRLAEERAALEELANTALQTKNQEL